MQHQRKKKKKLAYIPQNEYAVSLQHNRGGRQNRHIKTRSLGKDLRKTPRVFLSPSLSSLAVPRLHKKLRDLGSLTGTGLSLHHDGLVVLYLITPTTTTKVTTIRSTRLAHERRIYRHGRFSDSLLSAPDWKAQCLRYSLDHLPHPPNLAISTIFGERGTASKVLLRTFTVLKAFSSVVCRHRGWSSQDSCMAVARKSLSILRHCLLKIIQRKATTKLVRLGIDARSSPLRPWIDQLIQQNALLRLVKQIRAISNYR